MEAASARSQLHSIALDAKKHDALLLLTMSVD